MTTSAADLLRPITDADHEAVLAWNEEHVELLSPLDEPGLDALLGVADTAAIIRNGEHDAGFVITVPAGAEYDSPNYQWFAERHDHFGYLDRVVVDESARRTGLAGQVYDVLEARAAEIAPVFCLEVNIDPPNKPSLAFHRGRGFAEVGRMPAGDHEIALMEKQLTPASSRP